MICSIEFQSVKAAIKAEAKDEFLVLGFSLLPFSFGSTAR